MKKRFMGILLAVLLVFSMGTVAIAGIDMEAELNYEIGEAITDSYTQIAVNLTPDPFDVKLTWRRDWVPTLGDSVILDTGISLGYMRLGYIKEVLFNDAGTASLKLTKDPLTIEYTRLMDGLDLGILTIELAVAPFTFKYTNTFDGTSGGLFVKFAKSL